MKKGQEGSGRQPDRPREISHEQALPGFEPSREERDKILKDRAAALAREPEKEDAAREHIEVMEFLVAYESYALEVSLVREVYPLKDLTPVPSTPPFVLGIINVRGEIFSVIDVKKFFDLPEKGLGEMNSIIIVRNEGMEFGILADGILGVQAIPVDEIQPPPPTLTGIGAEYLKGVAKGRVMVLAGERILGDKRIVVHEEVET